MQENERGILTEGLVVNVIKQFTFATEKILLLCIVEGLGQKVPSTKCDVVGRFEAEISHLAHFRTIQFRRIKLREHRDAHVVQEQILALQYGM